MRTIAKMAQSLAYINTVVEITPWKVDSKKHGLRYRLHQKLLHIYFDTLIVDI